MKAILIALLLSTLSPCFGQNYFHQRLGQYDYWSGPNGYNGYGQQLGPYYFYHDNYGNGFGQQLGNYQFYQYNPYRYDPYCYGQ
jgi:hypothetical protein